MIPRISREASRFINAEAKKIIVVQKMNCQIFFIRIQWARESNFWGRNVRFCIDVLRQI
jgi:hypothetical protein